MSPTEPSPVHQGLVTLTLSLRWPEAQQRVPEIRYLISPLGLPSVFSSSIHLPWQAGPEGGGAKLEPRGERRSQAWTLWWVLARNVVGDRTPYKLPTCPYIVLRLMGWRASLVTQTVKKLPIMQETWVWTLGWGDPLKKGTATHSSVLAWRIPMDRGAWWAMVRRGRKESDMTEQLSAHTRWGDIAWRC